MLKKLTNKQILKKAIEKAIKNKYNFNSETPDFIPSSPAIVRSIIFNHDFAKAFWGRKIIRLGIEMGTNKGEIVELKNWQYHLQQMVLEKEPLKYLSKFL